MHVTGYAYPWDVLDDPGFADRVAELGVDQVAVATAYHTARAATPWSTRRAAVLAEHAAIYRPVRESAWAGRALRPAPASWVGTRDSAGDAVRALRRAGLPAALWLVLTHNSLLGNRNPGVAARNCFGDTYSWALCPSRPQVRDYAATLAAECVRDLEPRTVILESCGAMGAVHQSMHEKTDGVWAPAVARLLSVCCCSACAAGWRAAGVAPDTVVAALRAEVRRLLDTGDLDVTRDELPAELAAVLLDVRQAGTDALRGQVCDAVERTIGRPERLTLHGHPDPWATGALPGLTPAAPGDVDSVVVLCWQPGPAAVDLVRATAKLLPSTVDTGSYVTAVAAAPVPDMAGHVRELRAAGSTELHLYHLGLAGPARWPRLRYAVQAAHEEGL